MGLRKLLHSCIRRVLFSLRINVAHARSSHPAQCLISSSVKQFPFKRRSDGDATFAQEAKNFRSGSRAPSVLPTFVVFVAFLRITGCDDVLRLGLHSFRSENKFGLGIWVGVEFCSKIEQILEKRNRFRTPGLLSAQRETHFF